MEKAPEVALHGLEEVAARAFQVEPDVKLEGRDHPVPLSKDFTHIRATWLLHKEGSKPHVMPNLSPPPQMPD